jgi:hypothetical protein
LKSRDTKTNIRNIKDEIKKIDIANGMAVNMSSATHIDLKCKEFAEKISKQFVENG